MPGTVQHGFTHFRLDLALIAIFAFVQWRITGIAAPVSERTVILENVGAFDLVLKHDATSTAANRFYCPNDTDLTLQKDSAVVLEYDVMTIRAPSSMAAWYGGRKSLSSVASSIWSTPWSSR